MMDAHDYHRISLCFIPKFGSLLSGRRGVCWPFNVPPRFGAGAKPNTHTYHSVCPVPSHSPSRAAVETRCVRSPYITNVQAPSKNLTQNHGLNWRDNRRPSCDGAKPGTAPTCSCGQAPVSDASQHPQQLLT